MNGKKLAAILIPATIGVAAAGAVILFCRRMREKAALTRLKQKTDETGNEYFDESDDYDIGDSEDEDFDNEDSKTEEPENEYRVEIHLRPENPEDSKDPEDAPLD